MSKGSDLVADGREGFLSLGVQGLKDKFGASEIRTSHCGVIFLYK